MQQLVCHALSGYRRGVRPVSVLLFLLGAALSACGSRPPPREQTPPASPVNPPGRVSTEDECVSQDGRPVAPLRKRYEGLAKAARCDREVYTVMGGVTHSLGVKCEYCHAAGDYAANTHRKAVANWMAMELVPKLEKKDGGDVWCNDCHVRSGRGVAKLLGNPRDTGFAIEWMSTHLVERFERTDGERLLCKSCHADNVGSPGFRRKIVLSDPPLPLPERSASVPNATETNTP